MLEAGADASASASESAGAGAGAGAYLGVDVGARLRLRFIIHFTPLKQRAGGWVSKQSFVQRAAETKGNASSDVEGAATSVGRQLSETSASASDVRDAVRYMYLLASQGPAGRDRLTSLSRS